MGIVFVDGTQASTASEVNLFDITDDRSFALWLFTHNMIAGDELLVKVFVKDENSGTMRRYQKYLLVGLQDNPAKYIPFVPTKQYRVTIQRLVGSDRTYTWQRMEA